jgi:gamma-glutamylcyclotransferase (GGCT)/AIG2-like uncharacterized protein YtfP
MKMKNLPVFVYGTLRQGFGNHSRYLEGKTRIIVNASAKGTMFSVGGFPALIESPMDKEIKGELVFIQPDNYDKVLQSLDFLEGYRQHNLEMSMYLRKKVTVMTDGGVPVEAWVYYWNRSVKGLQLIESGCWKEYKNRSRMCPKCQINKLEEDSAMNALARIDNETEICSECGQEEALAEMGLTFFHE